MEGPCASLHAAVPRILHVREEARWKLVKVKAVGTERRGFKCESVWKCSQQDFAIYQSSRRRNSSEVESKCLADGVMVRVGKELLWMWAVIPEEGSCLRRAWSLASVLCGFRQHPKPSSWLDLCFLPDTARPPQLVLITHPRLWGSAHLWHWPQNSLQGWPCLSAPFIFLPCGSHWQSEQVMWVVGCLLLGPLVLRRRPLGIHSLAYCLLPLIGLLHRHYAECSEIICVRFISKVSGWSFYSVPFIVLLFFENYKRFIQNRRMVINSVAEIFP